MFKLLLWIHPLFQGAVTLLALYVGYMGLIRFRANHLGHKLVFPWKNHVRLGTLVYVLWTLGLLGGLTMTTIFWKGPFVVDDHYGPAMIMLGFMLTGYLTGRYMDRHKAKRPLLPLVHGLVNLVVLVQALDLAFTGAGMVWDFLL